MAKTRKKKVVRKSATTTKAPVRKKTAKKQPAPPVIGNVVLTKKLTRLKERVVAADKRDVPARYEIAVECHEILAGDGKGKRYGAGAAERLRTTLGWSKSAVHAYVAVADTWSKEEFRKLAAKRDKFEKPLSWTHYLVLAAEKDAEQRQALIEQTINGGWTVRDLKQAAAGNPPPGTRTTKETKTPRPLVNAVANYAIGLHTAKANADVFGTEIAKKVEDADPSDLNSSLLTKLKQARADLEAHYQAESRRLDALISKIEAGKHAATTTK